MKMMQAFFPIKQQSNGPFESFFAVKGTEGSGFQHVLQGQQSVKQEANNSQQVADVKAIMEKLMQGLEEGLPLEQIVATVSLEEIQALLNGLPAEESMPLFAMLVELIQLEAEPAEKELQILKLVQDYLQENSIPADWIPTQPPEIAGQHEAVEQEILIGQLMQLLTEIQQIFQGIKEDGTLPRNEVSGRLYSLIEQWMMLKRQVTGSNTTELVNQQLTEEESTIWKELVQRFEKRSFFAGQNMYSQDASVTKQDVVNWLQQAMNQYAQKTEVQATNVAPGQAVPVSEVEQYVIHVQNLHRVERVGTEVVEKFTNIIRESQFLKRGNQQMELTIMLRPQQLGQMTVRLVQMDGEMIAKILVSSQMAKDMLESNIHQLKHLFSPHQVSIERNEAISDEEFFAEDQHNDQEEQLEDGEGREQNHEQDGQPEMDFETLFSQLSKEEIDGDGL